MKIHIHMEEVKSFTSNQTDYYMNLYVWQQPQCQEFSFVQQVSFNCMAHYMPELFHILLP